MSIKNEDVKRVLGYYYDPYCGRFGIPVREVDEEKRKAIISLLQDGYAMSAYADEDDNINYVIFSLEEDSQGFKDIDKCKNVLVELESIFNCKYITKVFFDNYNYSYECLINTVLWKGALFENQVDDWSIALVCEEDSYKFIEVLNAYV